jgi:nucleoside-diphosphate-sugar epimerase
MSITFRFLVTGGAGFIGSHIVEKLVAEGHYVRVLDNFSTGKRENLAHLLDKIELIEGDIRDLSLCKKAVEGIDFVLHQAALPSVQRSLEEPRVTFEVNAMGTLNLLIACKDAKVKRLVYASSSSIYGDNPQLPKREDMLPLPISPYAVSKLAGEALCRAFYNSYGLDTVILRYFNVFGPRQDPTSQYSAVIPRFIFSLLKDERPIIFGDGNQTRDFTYVENVVEANVLAAVKKGVGGEVFNIAGGKETSVNELFQIINDLIGKSIEPQYSEPRKGEVRRSVADVEKAKRLLGYKIAVDLKKGLKRTVDYFRNVLKQS